MNHIKNVWYDNVTAILQSVSSGLHWVSSGLRGDEAGKPTQLHNIEVVVADLVSGPCPVGFTPLALFLWSVNSHTVKPESKGYQVVLCITVSLLMLYLYLSVFCISLCIINTNIRSIE